MPSPRNGNAGTLIAPLKPAFAFTADVADPGHVSTVKAEQRLAGNGKYGTARITPHRIPLTDEEKALKKNWIEIELFDKKTGRPMAGEPYEIVLPNSATASGTLDEDGFAHVDGVEAGNCRVTFPRFDKRSWARK